MIESASVRAGPVNATKRRPDHEQTAASAITGRKADALQKSAGDLERSFIAEMLGASGLAKAMTAQSDFGGDAYSRFLVEALADRIVERGGWGLADSVFKELKKDTDNETN